MPAHFNRQVLTIPLVFLLAASGIACREKTFAKPPPAPAATAAPAEPMEQPPPPQTAPPSQPPPALPNPAVAPPPPQEEAAQPKKPTRRASRPAATPAAAPPVTQPLRLGEMLTPEQERQYNAAIDQSLQRAQASLARLSKRQLSAEQQGVVAQVQSFIEQAQTTRKTNLTAAKSLAERADVLARTVK
ncbi:MAG TPA: hypothetical protein VIX89_02970 [Bryobacteraceae bacterium]